MQPKTYNEVWKMKIGIFIDGLTLYHMVKREQFDFRKFKEWLIQNNEPTILMYFNSLDNTETKKPFLNHVYKSGFELNIRKPLYNKIEEKLIPHGQDTELIIQAIHNKDKYDKFIIITGKHDFVPLCEYLTLQGKAIEIIGLKNTIHNLYEKYPQRHLEEFFN